MSDVLSILEDAQELARQKSPWLLPPNAESAHIVTTDRMVSHECILDV